MRDTIFPRWQGAFLALFLLADGLYLPASPETVRTLALGCVLSTFLAFLWLRMLSALRERDFESLCLHRFPDWLTRMLFPLVGIACIICTAQSLVRLTAFWHETAFSSLPRWTGALVLLLIGWRTGKRGRTAVAMWSYPLLLFAGGVTLLSLLVTLEACDPAHLPLVLQTMTISPSMLGKFGWFVLPLLLCAQGTQIPATRACTLGTFLGGVGLTLIALRAWLVLGVGGTQLPYPAFSSAGVFSVGDFLQRGEVLFGCALALCEAVRVALLVTLARTAFQMIRRKKKTAS